MRCRSLTALALASAIAGCGVRGVTTTGDSKPLRPPHLACPHQDRHKPVSTAPAAKASLVPGNPQAVLLCRYSGLNDPHRFRLRSSRLVTTRTSVDRLAHGLDALPKLPRGTVLHCPADFGDAVIVVFGYSAGGADPVTVGLSGCQLASNGHFGRLAGPAKSSVVAQLEQLTRR